MQYIKKILDVIIGFTGSSQNPEQMSLRFSSIIMGIIGKAMAVAAIAGYTMPFTLPVVQAYVGIFTIVVASMVWIFGLMRALWKVIYTR